MIKISISIVLIEIILCCGCKDDKEGVKIEKKGEVEKKELAVSSSTDEEMHITFSLVDDIRAGHITVKDHDSFINYTDLGREASISILYLSGDRLVSLRGIGLHFPNVVMLKISHAPKLVELSSIASLPKLHKIYLYSEKSMNYEELNISTTLKTLVISCPGLTHSIDISKLSNLEVASIVDAPLIEFTNYLKLPPKCKEFTFSYDSRYQKEAYECYDILKSKGVGVEVTVFNMY